MAFHLISRDALGALTKVGQGGQGIVYQAPKVTVKFADKMVFKEYKPSTQKDVNFAALSAMPILVEEKLSDLEGQGLVSIAAWPCAIVESKAEPVGFVMPAIPESFFTDLTTVKGRSKTTAEFQHLLNPPSVLSARGITITDEQRYQLLREVAKGLSFLHRIGVCVGDISPKNLLFSLNPRPAVYFLDCDAMRVNGVSALTQMETPEWQVPGGEQLATTYADTYKLGLLALRLLVGDQHTKNPQELPLTTPKPLRQLVTDTLTKRPDERPVPEAWAYLLGHVIDEASHQATDPLGTPPAPALPTYPPEPEPVVRNWTTTTRLGGTPAAASRPSLSTPPTIDDFILWLRASPVRSAALGAIILITVISAIALSYQGASSPASPSYSSTTSSNRTTTSTSPPPTTQSAEETIQQTLRNANVGSCLNRTLGPADSNGSYDILALTPAACGTSRSDVRVVSKQLFDSATDVPPCDNSQYGQLWSSGPPYPRVLLCIVYDR